MNGRTLFKRYSFVISLFAELIGLLPKTLRKHMLVGLRYKDGRVAMLWRYLLLKKLCKNCGHNVAVFPDVYFLNIDKLSIGDNVSIHQMCYIDAEGEIEIGDNVSIAHRSTVLSSNHGYDRKDIPIKYQEMKLNKTVIEDNVWIGCGSVVLAGVRIMQGCVIGANSTVSKNIDRNSIAVGSPAKVIKMR